MEKVVDAAIEVLKCRHCGILATSMKRFQFHIGKCRMLSVGDNDANSKANSSLQLPNLGDQKDMDRVTLQLPKIRLMKMSAADIDQISSTEMTSFSQPPDPQLITRKKRRLEHELKALEYFHEVTPPTTKRIRRQASIKALSNIRNAASQNVKITSYDQFKDDFDLNDDNDKMEDSEGPTASRQQRRKIQAQPPFESRKFPRERRHGNKFSTERTSDEIYSFQCQKCTAYYDSQANLDKHVLDVHEDPDHLEDIHTCPICDRMIWTRFPFQAHLKYHTDAEDVEESLNLWEQWPHRPCVSSVRFACKYCLMRHYTHHSFLTHMKAKHPDKERTCELTCGYCSTDDSFTSIKILVTHIKNAHHKEYYGDALKWKDGNPKSERRPRQACDICGKVLIIYHMKAHVEAMHHRVRETKQKKQQIPKRPSEQNKYECPLEGCGARLKTIQFLKRHFVLHLDNNPFVCKVRGCGIRMDAQCHLDRHMKIHTGEENVICPKCGLLFSRKDKLTTHICGISSKHVKYDPDGSKRAYQSHLRLKRCKKSELNEESKEQTSATKQFPKQRRQHGNISKIMLSDPVFIKACEENPKFKNLMMGTMGRTINDMRNPEAGKIYKCFKCHTLFNILKALQKHRTVCTGTQQNIPDDHAHSKQVDGEIMDHTLKSEDRIKFGCRLCGDSFETSEEYKLHFENDHTSEEIFRCQECDEIFPTVASRSSHFQRNHVVLAFPCFKCSRKYKSKETLTKHMNNHVNDMASTSICTHPECGKELSCITSMRRHSLLIHGVKVASEPRGTPKKATIMKSRNKKKQAQIRRKSTRKSETETNGKEREDNAPKIYNNTLLVKVEPDLHIDADPSYEIVDDPVVNEERTQIKVEAIDPVIKTEEVNEEWMNLESE